MAHFAELDNNNTVLRVIVVNNAVIIENGIESEQKGIDFCKSLYGQNTNWKKTSYNTVEGIYYTPNSEQFSFIVHPDQSKSFRKNYAGPGFKYDQNLDAFITPQPYPSWILDTNKGVWNAPVAYPSDMGSINDEGKTTVYTWDEATLSWGNKSYI